MRLLFVGSFIIGSILLLVKRQKMDPDECLRLCVIAIEGGWLEDAADHFYDLSDWLDMGGSEPKFFDEDPEAATRFYKGGFDEFCTYVEDAARPISQLL